MPHQKLIELLKRSLQQEIGLLESLVDEDYARPGRGPFQSSIGQHLRHNLDHFEAFFSGLEAARVDYESRERSELVSESTAHARSKIEQFIEKLDQIESSKVDTLLVRKEDGQSDAAMEWLPSSIGRELQFLLGHTVHHHAIICFILSAGGGQIPQGFGVAPSTQRYEARAQSSGA